jgi:hypothetical protein
MTTSLSVIVPAFNEATRLKKTLPILGATRDANEKRFEVFSPIQRPNGTG